MNDCEIFLFANKHCILFDITISLMHNIHNRDNTYYYNIRIFDDYKIS